MSVIAGPPGGGKSTAFGRDYFRDLQIPYFNIDERCAERNGSARGIPQELRNQAFDELTYFFETHLVLWPLDFVLT